MDLKPFVNVAYEPTFASALDNLSVLDKAQAYVALKAMAGAVETRLAALRTDLMIQTISKGVPEGKNGTKAISLDGTKVALQQRHHEMPEEEAFKALLTEKKIDWNECFDTAQVYTLNPSKLAYVISVGKVKEEEVEKCRIVTPALVIYASAALKAMVEPFKALAGKVLATGWTK